MINLIKTLSILNRNKFLLLSLLLSYSSFSQNIEKDTIKLKEVKIEANKKAKIKTVKFGKGKGGGAVMGNTGYTYLIEGIPEGFIQEITIHFDNYRMRDYLYTIDGKEGFRKKTVDKTEFEVTVYDIDNNMLGRKVNEVPILISLEESTDFYPKRVIDLSQYKFYSKRFFICINRITPLPCEDCYFYIVAHGESDKKLWTYADKNTTRIADDLQKKENDGGLKYCLRCEVKILTCDY